MNSHDHLSCFFSYKNLCTRCGTCVGVCPFDALGMDDQGYPLLEKSKCTNCGLCQKVCPGGGVDFVTLSEHLFTTRTPPSDYLGHYKRAYVGYASNPQIRANASGGGVVTQLLLYLLERGHINGAIVATMDGKTPWKGVPVIATSKDQLMGSLQSKYTIIPMNAVFSQLRKKEGQFALVGLPCQVHGFRKLARVDRKLASRIKVVIGLYCVSNLEQQATLDLLRISKIPLNDVKRLEYRGGEWPGRIRVWLSNGSVKNLHYSDYKNGAINYLTRLYSPTRCQTCVDACAELADISVGDAWTRGTDGKYAYKNHSMILVRTHVGQSLVKEAEEDSQIVLKPISRNIAFQTHKPLNQRKKKYIPIRLARMKKKNKIVPIYRSNFPQVALKDRVSEFLFSLSLLGSKSESLRYIILKFLLSPVGIVFIGLRTICKKARYSLPSLSKVKR